jgi:hypothetical protein
MGPGVFSSNTALSGNFGFHTPLKPVGIGNVIGSTTGSANPHEIGEEEFRTSVQG